MIDCSSVNVVCIIYLTFPYVYLEACHGILHLYLQLAPSVAVPIARLMTVVGFRLCRFGTLPRQL